MGQLTDVPLERSSVDRLATVLDGQAFDGFRSAIARAADCLDGHTMWHVNSTAEGGGVAEMLSGLLPYLLDGGVRARWMVIEGEPDFFDLTKDLHNALHGVDAANGALADRASIYTSVCERNADALKDLIAEGDLVFVHDPQPAGIVPHLVEAGAHVVWQCHIGTDAPNEITKGAWEFLRPFVQGAERYVFSREAYFWDGLDRHRLRVIAPAIDPLAAKNAPMSDADVHSVLVAAGVLDGSPASEVGIRHRVQWIGGDDRLPDDARVVLEVSRWDRLKDPTGFVRMFAEHLSDVDGLHLVFAGPETDGVDDDPEGHDVLRECEELWRSLTPDVRSRVHLLSVPMDDVEENALIVNALQRHAAVVVQKSLQEGFGLTVAEAMWKGKPVVATRVGGIQDQIEHGRSGLLVDDPHDLAAFATAVRGILDDPDCAERLGTAACERVADGFLGPRILRQYGELADELCR